MDVKDSRHPHTPGMSSRLSSINSLNSKSFEDPGHVDLELTSGEDRLIEHPGLNKQSHRVFC